MTTSKLTYNQRRIIQEIPMVNDSSAVYFYAIKSKSDLEFINILDNIIGLKVEILSKWLNITTRTFRNYRNSSNLILKENTKEHIILILSLYKHGSEVFENIQNFELWLSKENALLDHRAPIDFMETISGIQFIDHRLTAMEYGENA